MKSVILTGLPGSGKTTLGHQLAARLGLPFIDLDGEIEKAAKRSVAEIFEAGGEAAFRDMETRALHRLVTRQNIVLATGGGTVLRDENTALLSRMGLVVFVDRPIGNILGDIQIAHRPLLSAGPSALERLAAQRRQRYLDCADYVLNNGQGLTAALDTLLTAHAPLAAGPFAVIGEPIGHSLSPLIHSLAFSGQGLNETYVAIPVAPKNLPAFVAGAKKSPMRGFNVTLPHKPAILPLLDTLSRRAGLCGAVNTVVIRDGRLHGHNTDMEGLTLSLRHSGHSFKAKRVLVLGAGGAARATALEAALQHAAGVHIAARDPSKAEALAAHVAQATGVYTGFSGWSAESLWAAASHSDLLLNATPLGMTGFDGIFDDLTFLNALPKTAVVCDLIYTPPETALLKKAKALGLATQNGLGMLIYQALLAQDLFLDKELDKPALFEAVRENLHDEKKETAL